MFMLLNTVKDKLSFGWANSITELSITSEFSFHGFNGCQSSSLFCLFERIQLSRILICLLFGVCVIVAVKVIVRSLIWKPRSPGDELRNK